MRGERIGGGGSRASLRQPRRSFSPANKNHGGSGVQPGWQISGGIGVFGLR